MKKTKKITAAVMALTMVSALAPMAVFAEDQGMTVAYTYTPPAPTYTVTIPSGVTLSDSAAVEKNITAEGVANMEANGKKVVVTLDAATNDNDTDTTFHALNGESDATYTITAGETAVKVGDTVAEFTANGSSALTFSKITLPASPVAGDYTETLTFGIALADTALAKPTFADDAVAVADTNQTFVNTGVVSQTAGYLGEPMTADEAKALSKYLETKTGKKAMVIYSGVVRSEHPGWSRVCVAIGDTVNDDYYMDAVINSALNNLASGGVCYYVPKST